VSGAEGGVLVLVRDLLFSSRIGETARQLGYPCRIARTVEDFQSRVGEPAGLILVDLTAQGLDCGAALDVRPRSSRGPRTCSGRAPSRSTAGAIAW
jgi:hypothetical protein